ncbi:MAG: cyclomaltodextrinase N-terminal domain-containing protein, partial [Ignavibacterium sp.]|nr:cyclomaltodextrinase N-terminal domain-containing protein [Ignavibacterium sp.]MDW8376311.1 cyclomaltodextrinase N-terminal domain-containing protein [Ignavibacteriales bacterium]
MRTFCKFIIVLFLSNSLLFGQSDWIKRIEPPNWWTGFKNDTLQLLVYGNNISNLSVELEKNSVQLLGVKKAESPNYLFIDLLIPKIDKYLEFELKFFNGSKDTS